MLAKEPKLTCRPRWALHEARGKGVAVQGGGEAAVALFAWRAGRTCGPRRARRAHLANRAALASRSWLALFVVSGGRNKVVEVIKLSTTRTNYVPPLG